MARLLTVVVFCLCLAVVFAADLRSLIAERAAASGPPQKLEGKAAGDLDTASSWGWGGGFYGPGWGGGPWGWGPWGYGYGGGYGYPFGGFYGGYGGWW